MDQRTIEKIIGTFVKAIGDENLTLKQVYNAEKTSQHCPDNLKKTLVTDDETTLTGNVNAKDRRTQLVTNETIISKTCCDWLTLVSLLF